MKIKQLEKIIKINHYQKAADEIIYALKEINILYDIKIENNKIDFCKGEKTIIEMLKANFIAKKSKWKRR